MSRWDEVEVGSHTRPSLLQVLSVMSLGRRSCVSVAVFCVRHRRGRQGCLREVNAWYSSHEPRIFTSSSELDPLNKTRVRRFSFEGVSRYVCGITYLVPIPALNNPLAGQNVSTDTWPPVTSFPRETDGRGWSPEVLLKRFYISPLGGVLALPLFTHVLPHVRFTSDQGAQRQIFKALSDTMLPKAGTLDNASCDDNLAAPSIWNLAGSAKAAPSQSG